MTAIVADRDATATFAFAPTLVDNSATLEIAGPEAESEISLERFQKLMLAFTGQCVPGLSETVPQSDPMDSVKR